MVTCSKNIIGLFDHVKPDDDEEEDQEQEQDQEEESEEN